MEYKIENFEGPLDLLLHLISINEIDIYNIPISEITYQYIEYVEKLKEIDMEATSEFIVMASTLLEIKSKLLLPNNKFENEILAFETDDPRIDLVEKLLEYKVFKAASCSLEKRYDFRKEFVFKERQDIISEKKSDFSEEKISINLLENALMEVIRKVKIVDRNRMIYFKSLKKDEYTVKDKIIFIQNFLESKKGTVKFENLFHIETTKNEIIATFLALLEMIKNATIKISQDKIFGDILIYKI